jgi:hypothetical protein
MVPAREAVHSLAAAQKNQALSRNFPDHGDRNLRLGLQSRYDLLRNSHEKLVVLAAGSCENFGIPALGAKVLPRVTGNGQEVEVYAATHTAPLAYVSYIGGEPVG